MAQRRRGQVRPGRDRGRRRHVLAADGEEHQRRGERQVQGGRREQCRVRQCRVQRRHSRSVQQPPSYTVLLCHTQRALNTSMRAQYIYKLDLGSLNMYLYTKNDYSRSRYSKSRAQSRAQRKHATRKRFLLLLP